MDAKSLIGIAVVSVTEAARLGAVDEILFDTNPLRVAALKASAPGAKFVIPFDQIKTIGTDAVVVDRPEATQMASSDGTFGHMSGLAALQKLKIVDDAGTFIGTIQKIEFDTASGHVERLVAHRGGILGAGGTSTSFDGTAIHSVGAEIMTITAMPPES